MKLATFEVLTPAGPLRRIGAAVDGMRVDFAAAHAAHLENTDPGCDAQHLAGLLFPSDMRVLVSGEVRQVSAGTAVLFPQGAVHMLHNTGSEEMKVVCFFAPATGLDNYRLHEGVDFPD